MNKEDFLEKGSFIPYGKHKITESDIDKVVEILKSDFLTQGPTVPAFEKSINSVVKSQYSVAVNSATSALHIACLALGLSRGDYLWTSSTTFVSSANCGIFCNAKIDFVDIDPASGLISIKKLKEKLEIASRLGKLPKVLIPVHLAGNPCDMEEINNLAKKYNFKIIEDASHAIGAKYKGKFIGSCEFSNITVFSFHPVKIITTGEGGVATTNDPLLAQKMSTLRCHGIVKDPNLFYFSSPGPWFYEQQSLGFNYRLTDIHAALGLSQIDRLEEITLERNKLLETYRKLLEKEPVNFLEITKNSYSSVHLAVIRLENKDPNFHRKLFIGLRQSNIGVQIHYLPVHLHPYYRNLGFKEGDFPESELYAKNALSLPLYFGLSTEKQERVVKTLKSLLSF
tara:strand:- start:5031 stop:6221 length:1191 start_codon:yes stop_codon:yes gene_type:complete